MVNINQFNELEPIEYKTPSDYLMEKEEQDKAANDYREASIRMLTVMSLAMSYIIDNDSPLLAAYGVCFALGLVSVLGTDNMQDVATKLNCNDASVSWHARRFQQIANLPESPLLKPSRKNK